MGERSGGAAGFASIKRLLAHNCAARPAMNYSHQLAELEKLAYCPPHQLRHWQHPIHFQPGAEGKTAGIEQAFDDG